MFRSSIATLSPLPPAAWLCVPRQGYNRTAPRASYTMGRRVFNCGGGGHWSPLTGAPQGVGWGCGQGPGPPGGLTLS